MSDGRWENRRPSILELVVLAVGGIVLTLGIASVIVAAARAVLGR
jgi:hypothetical protein